MINDNDRAERDRHARCMSHVCRANRPRDRGIPSSTFSSRGPLAAYRGARRGGFGLTFAHDNAIPEVEPASSLALALSLSLSLSTETTDRDLHADETSYVLEDGRGARSRANFLLPLFRTSFFLLLFSFFLFPSERTNENRIPFDSPANMPLFSPYVKTGGIEHYESPSDYQPRINSCIVYIFLQSLFS